jgi:ABC-type sugar transport system ATPase subunit
MAQIRFEHVTRKFGKKTAVNDVSFSCNDGDFFTIIGQAGAGKSTILNMVAGIVKPTAGDIYIDGNRVNDLPIQDRDIAMAFEGYNLYPHMSVYDNVAFPLRSPRVNPKMSAAEEKRRVEEITGFLGISDYLDRKPEHLSGGQKQRVSLARALIRPARIYLLDEPIAHLDARLKFETQETLKKLSIKIGATIIYVTHDYREALSLSTRIMVLRNGIVEQIGTPKEVFYQPESDFVGHFIGNPPMNLFDGGIIPASDGVRVQVTPDIGFSFTGDKAAKIASCAWKDNGKEMVRLGIRSDHIRIAKRPISDFSAELPVFAIVREAVKSIVTFQLGPVLVQAESDDLTIGDVGTNLWIDFDRESFSIFRNTINLS